jgi:adenylyltransferase/sulfurtransferase
MKQLKPDELKQWIDSRKEFQILDVREKWEYDLVRFEKSILRPLSFLSMNPPELDRNKPVIVYCHHGVRSLRGCAILESLGFTEVYNLAGGIDLYARTFDPRMATY